MRGITYIYQRSEWPAFRWDGGIIANQLAAVRHRQGRLLGRMEALGFVMRAETTLRTLTQDALKTSEIEGDVLDREQVRSSLARRLGLETAGITPADRSAEAIATVVLDATQNFAQPLTADRLFSWHRSLFPEGGGHWNPGLPHFAWSPESSESQQSIEISSSSGPDGFKCHAIRGLRERNPRSISNFAVLCLILTHSFHANCGRTWNPVTAGAWRTEGRMIVASGPPDREVVHFEAPAASQVPAEMARFLAWFEDNADATDPVLKAAVAHIWFVTIHPFDDGNGRIGRAIADMALARSEGTGQRFYSMSARLRVERSAYYETLEATQKGDLDITPRLIWFLAVLDQALSDAEATLGATIRKSRFWESLSGLPVNHRQHAMLSRLLEGFEGKLTTSKWAQLSKCSQDTALRDIADLIRHGILVQDAAGGRSTSYSLAK